MMSEGFTVIQNLKDAGCDDSLIVRYMALQGNGYIHEQLHLLRCYRCHLLTTLHDNQRKLDCLDYLIYTLNKNTYTEKAEDTHR